MGHHRSVGRSDSLDIIGRPRFNADRGAPPVYLPHAGTSKSNCKNSTSGYRSSLVARLCTVSHQTPRWVLQIGAFAALGPVLEIIEELRARGVARHPQHQSAIGAGDRLGRRRHNGVLARGSEARGILARETSAIPRNGDSLVGSNVLHRSLTTAACHVGNRFRAAVALRHPPVRRIRQC